MQASTYCTTSIPTSWLVQLYKLFAPIVLLTQHSLVSLVCRVLCLAPRIYVLVSTINP